jgi:hypothetical protein
MLFHKQRVIKIVGEFVYLKISWQSGRENKAVMCESNPFSLDLQNLQNLETELCPMTARTLNFWLIKFVQEVCDKDGKPYPGRTVISIPNYMLVETTSRRKWPG